MSETRNPHGGYIFCLNVVVMDCCLIVKSSRYEYIEINT